MKHKYYLTEKNQIEFGVDSDESGSFCTVYFGVSKNMYNKIEVFDDNFTIFKNCKDVFDYLSEYKGEAMTKAEFCKMLDGFGYINEA
jgi:hypothetical protein